jgi:hypothetical protein
MTGKNTIKHSSHFNFAVEYAKFRSSNGEYRPLLLCGESGVDLIEEVRIAADPYYVQFLKDKNILVSYDIFKHRYEKNYRREYRERLIKTADPHVQDAMMIPRKYYPMFTGSFTEDPEQKGLFDKARHYIKTQYPLSLVISGKGSGQGKTLTANCILKTYFIENGYYSREIFPEDHYMSALNLSILFVNEMMLIELVQMAQADTLHVNMVLDIVKALYSADFLVFDDMFRNPQWREFLIHNIYSPVMHVRNEHRCVPSVITTNFTSEQIKDLDTPFHSRLKYGSIYGCQVQKDFRGIK